VSPFPSFLPSPFLSPLVPPAGASCQSHFPSFFLATLHSSGIVPIGLNVPTKIGTPSTMVKHYATDGVGTQEVARTVKEYMDGLTKALGGVGGGEKRREAGAKRPKMLP